MTVRNVTILLLIITIVLNLACKQVNQEQRIQGDLYFAAMRYGSFYDQPDTLIKAFENYADTANPNNADVSSRELLTKYAVLKKENLLYSPYVQLRLLNGGIIDLYLDTSDYDKIKVYKRKELQDQNQRIQIVAKCKDLGNGMSLCTQLISVDKIDGETLQVEKKLKIEDYQ